MAKHTVEDQLSEIAKRINNDLDIELLGEKSLNPYLRLSYEDQKPIIIPLSRELYSDFKSAIENYKGSSYFYTIENRIKWNLWIGLIQNEIYPDLIVSKELLAEKGDWIDPKTSANSYRTSFNTTMTQHIINGINYTVACLEAIIDMSKPYPIEDYKEDKKILLKFRDYYQVNKHLNDPQASVNSLQYLKASAVGAIIELETKKRHNKITKIKKVCDDQISNIIQVITDGLFFRIKIPEFMESVSEMTTGSLIDYPRPITDKTISRVSQTEHYDVAFSLAHEQRDYVDEVFETIEQIDPSLKVFYYRDKGQEVKLWGVNMVPKLQKIYRDQSDHVIIFVSQEYVVKRWTRHEWRSVQEAILDRSDEYLLPARFDDSELEGLHTTINYIDLREKNPEDFGKMIVEKINSLK